MSEKGECLDNAVAERFCGSLKREWTSQGYDATRHEARDNIIDYIEMWNNSRRKQSYLGYVSPNTYEQFALIASLSVRFSLTTTLGLLRQGGPAGTIGHVASVPMAPYSHTLLAAVNGIGRIMRQGAVIIKNMATVSTEKCTRIMRHRDDQVTLTFGVGGPHASERLVCSSGERF